MDDQNLTKSFIKTKLRQKQNIQSQHWSAL